MKNTLNNIEKCFTDIELKKWIYPLNIIVDESSNQIIVKFPHAYFENWFNLFFKNKFEEQISNCYNKNINILYIKNNKNASKPVIDIDKNFNKSINIFPFGPECTYEEFFFNQKNLFPVAIAKDLSKSTNFKFNPFIIYGEIGTGKTHLLKCMANDICKNFAYNKILFCSVNDLIDIFTTNKNVCNIKNFYIKYDFIFIDDIQQITNYKQFAHELLNMMEYCLNKNKLLILTSQSNLNNYVEIPKEIVTKIESGLSIQLFKPDLDVRIKFVYNYCQKKSILLTKSQMLVVSQKYAEFRTIKGILHKLQAYKLLLKRDITDSIFENIMGTDHKNKDSYLTFDTILKTACEYFKVTENDIIGNSRKKEIVFARQAAMMICRDELGLSYPALGKLFGGKDHSTVLYSIKKITKYQNVNQEMKKILHELRLKIMSLAKKN